MESHNGNEGLEKQEPYIQTYGYNKHGARRDVLYLKLKLRFQITRHTLEEKVKLKPKDSR